MMKGTAFSVFCFMLLSQYKGEYVAEYLAKTSGTLNDYMDRRAALFLKESRLSFGNNIRLSDRELLVDRKLKNWKKDDLQSLNFSGHYFSFQEGMRRSPVYQMLRRMPKGAALHVHGSLMLDPDSLLKLTYENHLYICLTANFLEFFFSTATPGRPCAVPWSLLEEVRFNHSDVSQFDAMLKQRLTLGPEDGFGPELGEDELWKKFKQTISSILSLIEYRPVREKMIYQSLRNFYDDNVSYLEIRIALHPLYELNGTFHDNIYLAHLHNKVATKFMNMVPDFAGLKLIISPSRRHDSIHMQYEVDVARAVHQALPNVVAGLDLVGQETKGRPIKDFLPTLLEVKDELNFYFHAGETNQYGTTVDENLFDAVLLGAKRIGHANALIKHPALVDAVRRQDIGLEVNVVSNSVLALMRDLRGHPLAAFLSLGLPVVLASDDPGVWGARPLTDDFYTAFVVVASQRADLRMLKQLVHNSIRYSSLDDWGKVKMFLTFERKWLEFINYVVNDMESD